MPYFSEISKSRLETCHEDLQRLLHEAIKHRDFSIICGHRNQAAQKLAYLRGKSNVQFPNSKHNSYPSVAVDIAPYPIDWDDRESSYLLGGYIIRLAHEMGIPIRTGADWNNNGKTRDQTLHDPGHIELLEG